jgi:hypothetical protein
MPGGNSAGPVHVRIDEHARTFPHNAQAFRPKSTRVFVASHPSRESTSTILAVRSFGGTVHYGYVVGRNLDVLCKKNLSLPLVFRLHVCFHHLTYREVVHKIRDERGVCALEFGSKRRHRSRNHKLAQEPVGTELPTNAEIRNVSDNHSLDMGRHMSGDLPCRHGHRRESAGLAGHPPPRSPDNPVK